MYLPCPQPSFKVSHIPINAPCLYVLSVNIPFNLSCRLIFPFHTLHRICWFNWCPFSLPSKISDRCGVGSLPTEFTPTQHQSGLHIRPTSRVWSWWRMQSWQWATRMENTNLVSKRSRCEETRPGLQEPQHSLAVLPPCSGVLQSSSSMWKHHLKSSKSFRTHREIWKHETTFFLDPGTRGAA